MKKTFRGYLEEATIHPKAVHAKSDGKGQFEIKKLGPKAHKTLKVGDKVSSSDLDDLSSAGHKVKEITEGLFGWGKPKPKPDMDKHDQSYASSSNVTKKDGVYHVRHIHADKGAESVLGKYTRDGFQHTSKKEKLDGTHHELTHKHHPDYKVTARVYTKKDNMGGTSHHMEIRHHSPKAHDLSSKTVTR